MSTAAIEKIITYTMDDVDHSLLSKEVRPSTSVKKIIFDFENLMATKYQIRLIATIVDLAQEDNKKIEIELRNVVADEGGLWFLNEMGLRGFIV